MASWLDPPTSLNLKPALSIYCVVSTGQRVKCVYEFKVLDIDGFQMSIKRPTSGGQARAQEAAVQQIFHLERSSFFYL